MPRRRLSLEPKAPDHDGLPVALTDDQIDRYAELIADGRYEFPENLRPPDKERLQREVRRWLRERMVRLISRAIAHHFGAGAGPIAEDSEDV
jgi:hypothetical protein